VVLFTVNVVWSAPILQSRLLAPQKFDEFGDIDRSDLKARLDNFKIALQASTDSVGFIIVYRSRRDLPGLSHSLALGMKEYLLSSRDIEPTRLALVDGGVADHLVQELWIVPRGSAPKPRDDVRIGYFYSPDTASKFFHYGFLPREMFKRFEVGDDFDSNAEYLDAFATEVKKDSTRIACIIAYAQYNPARGLADWSDSYEPKPDVRLDPPGTAQKRLSLEKKRLIDTYGIPARRIRTIDGGYRKRREVELWIVPSAEPMPIPTPNSFPRARRIIERR
jgi:hypothetical protein